MTTFTTQTKDLWAIAIAKVGDDDKAQLDISCTDKVTVLDNILSLVRAKQAICMQKRWKFKKSSGESLVVRDLVDKIAVWVGKFIQVGDAAVQYDPTHAALPWAAVRFLLQITFNDVRTFGTVAEGVEAVSRLIARYAIFEAAYLHSNSHTPSVTQERLSEALVVLYSAILRYLAKAGRYYNQSTAERLAKSIIRPADTVQRHFELILKEEMAVHKLADIMHAEMISALTKNVNSFALLYKFKHPSMQQDKRRLSPKDYNETHKFKVAHEQQHSILQCRAEINEADKKTYRLHAR